MSQKRYQPTSLTRNFGPNPLFHISDREYGGSTKNFTSNLYTGRLAIAKNLYKKDLIAHYGCVNAIEFSHEGELLASGGDDRRVLLWHLSKDTTPNTMTTLHQSNIFCLGFNSDNTRLFSGGNDDMVLVHDLNTRELHAAFLHIKPIYGLAIDPMNDNLFATAGEDGRILFFDLRQGETMELPRNRGPCHAVQYHPLDGNYVITANGKDGAALWDLRHHKSPSIRYGGPDSAQSCMSVRFNTLGTQVLALRRRLPPILYSTHSSTQICQFYHPDYYNSCTMKSCCFAGDNDEYVLSGSDDFNLYVWRVNDADIEQTNQWIDTYHMVLYGHRSIVNQVRYNPQKCLIASSGVEKLIKLWHPFAIHNWSGGLLEELPGQTNTRDVFTHDEYAALVNSTLPNISHDYSNQNTLEDPRMMAFFDSLVQREIEGWNSNDSSSNKISEHSSDDSSRSTTPSDTSDNDVQTCSLNGTNNLTLRRNTRLRSMNAMPPRIRYPNRIAYLIATKRNTLKRLALKGAANTERRVKYSKMGGHGVSRNSSNRRARVNCRKRATRPRNNAQRHDRKSENDEPTTKNGLAGSKRFSNHFKGMKYRTTTRKKRPKHNVSCSTTSSDGDDDDDDTTNVLSNNEQCSIDYVSRTMLKRTLEVETGNNDRSTSPKQLNCDDRNDKLQEVHDTPSVILSNLPVPSTSTGITANGGSLFRVVPQTIDSEDDITPPANNSSASNSPINLVRVIPMPINGTHNFNTTYSSGIDDNEHPDDNQPTMYTATQQQRRRKRSYNRTHTHHYNSSSHSSSRVSSSPDDDDIVTIGNQNSDFDQLNGNDRQDFNQSPTTNDSLHHFYTTNGTSIISQLGSNFKTHLVDTCSPTKSTHKYERTPNDTITYLPFTPDSGVASMPGSSGCNNNNINNNNNNLGECSNSSKKLFLEKVKFVRRNYGHAFGDDSESD